MNAIGSTGIPQQQQYYSQIQNHKAQNSVSEEANESPAEKAAEANSKGHKFEVYA